MDWGGANSRFLGLVSVGAARSLDQTTLRPSVIKRIRHIDVKYITHNASHACGWRQEGHPVEKLLHQYSSLTPLEMECYEGEVQPYRKIDYKPILHIVEQLHQALGSTRQYLLLIHAITGCDTTSALYGQGKVKTLKLAQEQDANLCFHMDLFSLHSRRAVPTYTVWSWIVCYTEHI